MTEQQLNELKTTYAGHQLSRALFYTNNAYVLADVINSYMMEADSIIKTLGQGLRQENKQRFKRLLKMTKDTLAASKAVAKEIYDIPSEDAACEDSDFFYEAILLIARKTGNTTEAQQRMLDYLKQLPDANAEIVKPENK